MEFSAVQSVYGPSRHDASPLVVGSIKSSIGHLESSSALASVIKVVECLERGQIPPQMHFRNPNPEIDFKNVHIPTELIQWPTVNGTVRRAAINTFGAGGTNGHAVLESYPKAQTEPAAFPVRPYLFKVSAADDASLQALALQYAQYVRTCQPFIQDLAYTLLARRSTLRKSVYFTASSIEQVAGKLQSETHKIYTKSQRGVGETLFVFTGQGAQWCVLIPYLLQRRGFTWMGHRWRVSGVL